MSAIMSLVNGREMTPEEVTAWLKARRAEAPQPREETPAQRRERLAGERAERLRNNIRGGHNGRAR
jgi:hypothetical protein